MESGYLWGGTLAGLVFIAALGVLLARRSQSLREALSQYVGEQPARGLLYSAWFIYAYGLLFALTQAYYPTLESTGLGAPPAAISFLYGVFGRSVLWFFNAAIPIIQLLALIAVAVLLLRHLEWSKSTET